MPGASLVARDVGNGLPRSVVPIEDIGSGGQPIDVAAERLTIRGGESEYNEISGIGGIGCWEVGDVLDAAASDTGEL